MRLVSVQPADGPVVRAGASIRIGAAQDDDVVVRGAGVAPHHATIVADARGLVLTVASACQRVYVNARAVQERALLRHGDALALGDAKLLLTADVPPPAPTAPTEPVAKPGLAGLRVLSGPASGTALPVRPELRMGAGSDCFGELAFTCRVYWSAATLAMDADGDGALVNGWACRHARLDPGDQLVLGAHRLLVEAPGLEFARHQALLPPPVAAPVRAAPLRARSVRAEIAWLLLAALVLAAGIALLLYFHG